MIVSEEAVTAIGGMGGSGTRIFVDVLQAAGLRFDPGLNQTRDNVLFSRFLNDPAWLDTASPEEIADRLRIFEHIMKGRPLTAKDLRKYLDGLRAHGHIRHGGRKRLAFRWQNFRRRFSGALPEPWAWKEPHTQVMLPELKSYFSKLKYVHVSRHGLDMAFSSNLGLLTLWGQRYGLSLPDNPAELPLRQLDIWIRSHETVEALAAEGGEIHFIRYEDLCQRPTEVLPSLLEFLGLKVTKAKLEELIAMPRLSRSSGRFRQKDLGIFSPEQLAAVEARGYTIDSRSSSLTLPAS